MKHKVKSKVWAGRFAEAANPVMEAFTSSLAFDKRLALYDIRGSMAHSPGRRKDRQRIGERAART
jgi:argininosuccinate lyase